MRAASLNDFALSTTVRSRATDTPASGCSSPASAATARSVRRVAGHLSDRRRRREAGAVWRHTTSGYVETRAAEAAPSAVSRSVFEVFLIRSDPVLGDLLLRRSKVQLPSTDHVADAAFQPILGLSIPFRFQAATHLRPEV
jgi:hypothetical protein